MALMGSVSKKMWFVVLAVFIAVLVLSATVIPAVTEKTSADVLDDTSAGASVDAKHVLYKGPMEAVGTVNQSVGPANASVGAEHIVIEGPMTIVGGDVNEP